ncbi:hypothetical protein HJD18_15295 [Thermoleophilia bacterium SCSIO 60948]|nr:hypothetical protein HJD18_15295 [Thermoleophilia bacterium SCSIO 60948]
MIALVARIVLGGFLIASAVLKLASPQASREATATFGFTDPRAQAVVFAGVTALELVLGVGVIAGAPLFAPIAAFVMAMFAATLVATIMRGRAGAPCACFGARSTVSWSGVVRNLVLAAGFAAIPFLPETEPTTESWLILGVVAALALCLLLGVAVLALAREVGMLRLRLGPASALEITHEGPPLGERSELADRISFAGERTEIGLAVFLSESCHICHGLRPAVDSLRTDPLVSVETFEEEDESALWENLGVPGSPYAVAIGRDGVSLAKGSFNNLAQLESVLAAAERRSQGDLMMQTQVAGS